MKKMFRLITSFSNCGNISRRGRMRCTGSLMVVILMFSLSGSPRANAQSTPDVADRKLATDYLATWTALDAKGFAALFDAADTLFLATDFAIPSADSIRVVAAVMMEERASNRFAWEKIRTTVLNDSTALFQGIFGGRVVYKNGQISEWKGNGLLTFLAARRAGVWRITAAHASAGTGTLVNK